MTLPVRITLHIDRIVTDRPGLNRAALTRAIEAEVQQIIATRGPGGLGPSRSLSVGRHDVAAGKAPLAARVAQATLAAVRE